MLTIDTMVYEAHKNSMEHGFWEGQGEQDTPEKLMLIVTEVAEAMEEYRKPGANLQAAMYDEHNKPVGFASELADILIRVGDLAGFLGINLEEAVEEKMAYNRMRPHKHGKRC